MGIVRYGVDKTPVGRGQCAPPLGVQYVSAAAHMGAALQRNLQNMRRGDGSAPPVFPLSSMQAGGVEPRPYAGQDGFRKNVIPRSTATWESVPHVAGVRREGITDCHTSLRAGSQ